MRLLVCQLASYPVGQFSNIGIFKTSFERYFANQSEKQGFETSFRLLCPEKTG